MTSVVTYVTESSKQKKAGINPAFHYYLLVEF
jgi:hypothetical protein